MLTHMLHFMMVCLIAAIALGIGVIYGYWLYYHKHQKLIKEAQSAKLRLPELEAENKLIKEVAEKQADIIVRSFNLPADPEAKVFMPSFTTTKEV